MNSPQQIIAHAEACNIVLYLKGEQLAYISEEGGFPDELKTLIRENKDQISAYLREQELLKQKAENETLITPVDKSKILPLTFAQQGLWFIDQLEGGSNQYNIHAAFGLKGELNLAAVQWAVNKLIERHQVLRTVYIEKEGEVCQEVQPLQYMELPIVDLKGFSPQEQQERILQISNQEMNQVFNLQSDLMLKAKVVVRTEHDHVLFFTLHHIASDAWSQAIMIQEFATLYESYCKQLPDPLPMLDIQYCDYAHWQRNYYTETRISEQLVYWEKMLKGAPYSHALPFDRPRGAQQKFAGKTHSWFVDNEQVQGLKARAKENQATFFMMLYTAFSVLIGRWSQTRDVVIGSPIAGRTHPQVSPMIGYFINSMTYRSEWTEGESFRSLLGRNRENTLSAFDHQDIPFDSLVDRLKIPRELSHSPLFQVMFTLQNTEKSDFELNGLETYPVMGENSLTKYDLQMVAEEGEGGLWLNLTYSTDLFDFETVQSMSNSFDMILRQLSVNVDIAVDKLALANTTEALTPKLLPLESFTSVHSLIENMVETKGDATAIDSGDCSLTYKELNEKANQLARYLIQNGVVQGQQIHLCAIQGVSRYVAKLAVLKAGAIYECHDIFESTDWFNNIVAQGSVLLFSECTVSRLSGNALRVPSDDELKAFSSANMRQDEVSIRSFDRAIMDSRLNNGRVSHALLLQQVLRQQQTMQLNKNANLLIHPETEKTNRIDWITGLASGAKLVLLEAARDLEDTLITKEVTHLTLTAALLADVTLCKDYAIQQLIIHAESGADSLLWRWSELYSVTSVLSLGLQGYICAEKVIAGKAISLGRAFDKHQAKVMFDDKNLAPTGAIGYLYTVDANNNFENTNMLVRETNAGTIEAIHYGALKMSRDDVFLENIISAQPQTIQVAVIEKVVYLRLSGSSAAQQEQLKAVQHNLKQLVPTYLLPKLYVIVSNMPIRNGGTVNREALWHHTQSWQDNLAALPQPELLEADLQLQGSTTETVDFFLDKEVSFALRNLACQYNVTIAKAFSAIFNLALVINSESDCILSTVSGVSSSTVGSGVLSSSFCKDARVQDNLKIILDNLSQGVEYEFVDKNWITQQYNQKCGTDWKTIFAYQLKFVSDTMMQQELVTDSSVSLLVSDRLSTEKIEGQWRLQNSCFDQSTLRRLEKIIAMLASHELQSKTLAEVKTILNEDARSKLRSAKRKFKSVRNKSQFSVEGNVA
ncbi:condensation domain-containing protein [Pseudoalteromonas piscicida]|uniref:Uncharacterized protein n=1 Tax=Pseudoalteromonas piscicida TaxID=43662 RepID=A0ABM6NHM1_PSEO7|nr:condensation domain-containing protein [Pseudoalteromonas piscicida]ATD08341.1 hypothetical protein PPIS_a3572 [Pseudoalteromonas piscicida]WPU30388.1 condensation domain-containing protein [Pseudoalteromonas piscicida]